MCNDFSNLDSTHTETPIDNAEPINTDSSDVVDTMVYTKSGYTGGGTLHEDFTEDKHPVTRYGLVSIHF